MPREQKSHPGIGQRCSFIHAAGLLGGSAIDLGLEVRQETEQNPESAFQWRQTDNAEDGGDHGEPLDCCVQGLLSER